LGEYLQMRTIGAAVVSLCLLAGVPQTASAEEAAAPGTQASQACGKDKLGVARTAIVNAGASPHFGAQYKSPALLADREVVLTFDDGPSRIQTRPILEALAAHCTRATFFMLGQMALADPQLVKDVARAGHTVATHTWSHPNLQSLAQGGVQNEIELGFSAVQQALGKPIAPFFRFPYLRDTGFAIGHLKSRNIAVFGIDVDSRDFQTKEASAVYDRVMREVTARRKGIVLFHDIHGSTARALPRILDELQWRGFRIVHLAPKAAVETVAEYDAIAEKAADRRRLAAAGNPLAKRAITFPSVAPSEMKELVPPPSPASAPPPARGKDWTIDFWRQPL
jgi:peptidoglycan/xylan/chitin deacetylase (PgdA/CDA1 family)